MRSAPRHSIVLNPNVSEVTSRSEFATVSPAILDFATDLWVMEPNNELSNEIKGTFPALDIDTTSFNVKQSNALDPVFHKFNVEEGYRYIG